MRSSFLLLVLCAACSNDPDPTGTASTGSATGGGAMPCTSDLGEVSGTVLVDAHDGNAPTPAADTEFTFLPSDNSGGITTKTDADGGYLVTLPAMAYTIDGSPGNCAPVPAPALTVEACGELAFDFALELCFGN